MATAKATSPKTKPTKTTAKTAKRPSATTAVKSDNVVPLNSDISAQIDVLRADLKALASSVKAQAKARVETRKDTAMDVYNEQAEAAKARYAELTTQTETRIREKPLTSMAIAVGAGLVLGAVLRK